MSSKNLDRLSTLPEEILSHILSLMPTIFAVRTSSLSKRWRYTWMFVTNLVIDDNTFSGLYSLTKFVDGVLTFCKTSKIKLFRLHFRLTCGQKSHVSYWIDKVVRSNVHELDLRVDLSQLPLCLFTCKTLTKLRLDRVANDYYVLECSCPYPVNLPCLKTLDMVGFTNPFFNAFINGCPMLESLSLEVSVTQQKDEEDYVFNIPTLKRLKLRWVECALIIPIKKVVLRVPNLEYLSVSGILRASFVMEDVSSLIEASISSSIMSFLQQWPESGVKSISIQNEELDTLATKYYGRFKVYYLLNQILSPSTLNIFQNMKQLKMKNFWHYRTLLQILESSPKLKHLYIEQNQKLNGSCWLEPKLVPACMLTNLTTIKFSNNYGRKYHTRFLKYMLGNAKVLKTVTITWQNSTIEEESRLYTELLKLPMASRCCEIHFHGNRSSTSTSNCKPN